MGQDYDDWEVVLVDDGSTDNSASMCDDYAERDSRISVIHQDNAGTSAARNAGIEVARGRYVTFMDNDDWWIDSACLGRVVDSLTERPVDLLWHMSARSNVDGTVISDVEATQYSGRVAALPVERGIRFIIDHGLTTSAVWTKVVRRELLIEHDIIFPVGMRNEDTEWSAKVLAYCRSVGWFDERFYVYRMGHPYAQTSHRLVESSVRDLEMILRDNLVLARSLSPDRREALLAFLAYPFIVWTGQADALGLLSRGDKSSKELLSQMPGVICHSRNRVSRMTCAVCRIFGARTASRLLGLAFRRKHPQHS